MKKIGMIMLAVLLLAVPAVTASAADSATLPYEDLKYVAGDVNCDEAIDAADMATLKQILLGTTDAVRVNSADCNGDGVIGVQDLVRLKKYFAGSAKLGK